jgi:DNA-damage-inducible protein J
MAVVSARLDEETKRKAEVVLAQAGVSPATFIQAVFFQIAEKGVLPFEPFEPNAETIEAIEASRRGEGVTVGDVAGLLADLHADD